MFKLKGRTDRPWLSINEIECPVTEINVWLTFSIILIIFCCDKATPPLSECAFGPYYLFFGPSKIPLIEVFSLSPCLAGTAKDGNKEKINIAQPDI